MAKPFNISTITAESIAYQYFGIQGKAKALDGYIDLNFKITCAEDAYILKISKPETPIHELDFQQKLLSYIECQNPDFQYPKMYKDKKGKAIFDYTDEAGNLRQVRLLSWIEGRLYHQVMPKTENLRYSLGQQCGKITSCLQGFQHDMNRNDSEWNLANALWVEDYLSLFSTEEQTLFTFFIEKFKAIQPIYQTLRKSTIHNDANEHNIVVSNDLQNPQTLAIIDYGDAVYTQIINDVAILLAYNMMECREPLEMAKATLMGYHHAFPLQAQELAVLYPCIAMRLMVSLTKSAIGKQQNPDNLYLCISEKNAWELLRKWKNIDENFAHYYFRNTCGLNACKYYDAFLLYAKHTNWDIDKLLPENTKNEFQAFDLSIDSPFVGNFQDYQSEKLNEKIQNKVDAHDILLLGGYGEARPIYTTNAYKISLNEGYEHRTIHLGVDFWTKAYSAVHAVENGEIFACHDNANDRDFGPTIILKHVVNELIFYTLYGHLSRESLVGKKIGQAILKGEKIAEIGNTNENGNWASHLHFQIVLDMLGLQNDFYGVSSPSQWAVFSSICPDPNLLFHSSYLLAKENKSLENQIDYRKKHLGKSLSLSYNKPLKIVRGEMQYLIDEIGQKYLDTVNNVAHVGHEHPKIVAVGQQQMAILNTNTRYLNDEILSFAAELLKTFPPELSVLHFVNSGSEANELALRMAKVATGQKDVIALEVGYHGNTQACIDISSYKFEGKGGGGCPEYTHIVPLPDAFRGLYQGENTGLQYAKHVLYHIEKLQSKGRNVAAFIAESIVSCGGQIDLPRNFLSQAYEYVRAAGGVCIADEVQVGFGRVGKFFWGFELHHVIPDIVTMGKPIGNGHPLAAVVCTRKIADAFANGMEYFNTFGGNPVSCAIGNKVLTVIREDKLQENAAKVGAYLKEKLLDLRTTFPILADIRGEGLFLGIELTDSQKIPLPEQTSYLSNRMKDFKVLTSIDGPQHNVLKIKPPMCFSIENADYFLATLHKILREDFMTHYTQTK